MFDIFKLNGLLVLLFVSKFSFSQNYDIGYNTPYITINNTKLDTNQFKETIYTLSDNKEVKKIFNNDGALIEELVFIDGELSAGIEYFTHYKFNFLGIPRHFEVQTVEREISNYENIKFSSSLIQYMPKSKKAVFRVRVYTHDESEFYILKLNRVEKLYFK